MHSLFYILSIHNMKWLYDPYEKTPKKAKEIISIVAKMVKDGVYDTDILSREEYKDNEWDIGLNKKATYEEVVARQLLNFRYNKQSEYSRVETIAYLSGLYANSEK